MASRRIRWFIGDPTAAVHLEAAANRQRTCTIGTKNSHPRRAPAQVVPRTVVVRRGPQGSLMFTGECDLRCSATSCKTMVYGPRCEFVQVDTKGSADRLAHGEKVWNSERFGALFHIRERHSGGARLRGGVWVEARLLGRSRPFRVFNSPAEEAVTEGSRASSRGATRYRSMNGLQLACGNATCSWLPVSKDGMALAVSHGRVGSGQSRQALNEERAQI
jgi:hypothetical protein